MIENFGIEIEVCGFERNQWGRAESPWITAANTLNQKPNGLGGHFDVVCESYNDHRAKTHWKTVIEYSVSNGLELISPVMPNNESSYIQLRTMMGHLRDAGCNMSRNCGQHVHLDIRFMKSWHPYHVEQFMSFLISEYGKHENIFDSFVLDNRRYRNNFYCKTMVGKSLYSVIMDREHKVSFGSYERFGTIEFRHFHGTLNGDASVAWIKLCSKFLENCVNDYKSRNDVHALPNTANGYRILLNHDGALWRRAA